MIVRPIAIAAVAIAACGGAERPAPSGRPSNRAPRKPNGHAGATVDADAICDRIEVLAASGCAAFAGYDLGRDECVDDFKKSLDDRGPEARSATLALGGCLVEHAECADVEACVDELGGPDDGFRACDDHTTSAVVGRPRAEWAKRRGATARTFSDVTTSVDEPIEVCTIGAEKDWLMATTCDDGSHPFSSRAHAHAARVGNVGAGGACGSIIDLFAVPCPEATYEVYMDAYVCPID